MSFEPFLLSFKLASLVTISLFFVCVPLAWWLFSTKIKIKPFLEAFFSLPIVLPPSVLGFYILIALSGNSFLGAFFKKYLDIEFVFSFQGLVLASIIYSFPFMLQPLQSGFESLDKSMLEASYIAGKGKLKTILKIALPNIKPSILSGIVITFAHTVGEFGVVLMVGGSIPGKTKVASVAIYEMVENLEYNQAHIYSGIMVVLSFSVLLAVYIINHRYRVKMVK